MGLIRPLYVVPLNSRSALFGPVHGNWPQLSIVAQLDGGVNIHATVFCDIFYEYGIILVIHLH